MDIVLSSAHTPRRLVMLSGVPLAAIAITFLASLGASVLALLQGWPSWAIALAVLVPWLPVYSLDVVWTSRQYGWLALFYVLVVSQGGHFLEHVAQMVQIHLMGRSGPGARGVFGQLDVEWVHFVWNTWVLAAVVLLVVRFRCNLWLWTSLLFAAWHEIEHAYLLAVYLDTGRAGGPGLLAEGGRLFGGLPLTRPDLHFLYNLIETIPLLVAFAVEFRRARPDGRASAPSLLSGRVR
jgi:hypothetical protein